MIYGDKVKFINFHSLKRLSRAAINYKFAVSLKGNSSWIFLFSMILTRLTHVWVSIKLRVQILFDRS